MPWSRLQIEREEPETLPGEAEGRVLSYADAVREALSLSLSQDPKVYVMGQGSTTRTACSAARATCIWSWDVIASSTPRSQKTR